MGRKKVDLTGKKFGRWTVLRESDKTDKRNRIYWRCLCECGNQNDVTSCSLRRGNTRSCGCLRRERAKEVKTKHNMSGKRVYNIWRAMKERCHNPNNTVYEHYGARGITVCEEWKNSFESFHKWATNNSYSDELTIDRIDNDKGYGSDNCRWVTMKEQSNNKRNTVYIDFANEVKTITEWAEISGISLSTLNDRLRKGWTDEEILGVPVGMTRKQYYKNEQKST